MSFRDATFLQFGSRVPSRISQSFYWLSIFNRD